MLLSQVYGYSLIELAERKNTFIIVNNLDIAEELQPNNNNEEENEESENQNETVSVVPQTNQEYKINSLLNIILCVIFMKGGVIQEREFIYLIFICANIVKLELISKF